jgi:hypothetical protein
VVPVGAPEREQQLVAEVEGVPVHERRLLAKVAHHQRPRLQQNLSGEARENRLGEQVS